MIKRYIRYTRLNNIVISIFLFIVILYCLGLSNLISYLYTLIIFFILNNLFPPKYRYYNFLSFQILIFIALIIYCIQIIEIPSYMGLSGPEGGIGTDDIRYYEKLVDIPIKISSTATWVESYPFTDFIKTVYPFKVVSPLNIIIFNILGTCFIPSLTGMICMELYDNYKIAKKSGIIILLCPFLWSNGLIIMRDAWTVSLVLLILLLTFQRHYILAIFPCIFLAYLRFGSVFFALIGVIVILKRNVFNKKNLLFWGLMIAGCLVFISCINFFIKFSAGRIETSLFRETFIESLIRDDENGIITRLAQLPVIIRTPLLFLFFYFTPFFKIKFYTLNVFNIRFICDTLLTSIWLFFCLKYLFRYIYISFNKKKDLQVITWISIYLALALSIISLQIRHKLVMMPIFAIMAAIGMNEKDIKYDKLFTILSTFIIIVEIIFSFR